MRQQLYREFGKLVQLHRKRIELTQDQLAARVGLSRTSITNIEQGRQNISLHQLYAIAEALQVSPEVLLPAAIGVTQIQQLPSGIDKDIRSWAQKVVTRKS